jgi:Protein of unknown function (DUF3303)
MKYVVTWQNPETQTDAQIAHAFKIFRNKPENKALRYQQMVGRLDNRGGFMVVETDDPSALAREAAMFQAVGACHIHPVLDIQQIAQIGEEALKARAAIK